MSSQSPPEKPLLNGHTDKLSPNGFPARAELEPLVKTKQFGVRSASGFFPPSPSSPRSLGHASFRHGHASAATLDSEPSDHEVEESNREASKFNWRFISCLYAMIIFVLGAALPMSEIISVDIGPYFYQSFYLYLHIVSLLFLAFAFVFLFNTGRKQKIRVIHWWRHSLRRTRNLVSPVLGEDVVRRRKPSAPWPQFKPHTNSTKTGSFYLRVGAIVFGFGTMLYSCLEFGQYFELRGTDCDDIFWAITPVSRFLFTFVQVYMIFVNAKIRTDRYSNVASFGLMHMLATNMCIWLSVLIEETKHELEHNIFEPDAHRPAGFSEHFVTTTLLPADHGHGDSHSAHNAPGPYRLDKFINTANEAIKTLMNESAEHHPASCRSRTSMGGILQQASPFLFPCIVENSLICAALLYVMWQGLGTEFGRRTFSTIHDPGSEASGPMSTTSAGHVARTKQTYTVDCRGASRGLFMGLLVMMITIISIALFFVWIWKPEFYTTAIYQAYIVEIFLYSSSLAAVIIASVQVRCLKFDAEEGSRLDDILLVLPQMGVYIFPTFILISGRHNVFKNPSREEILGMVSAFLELTQSTFQTFFMLDAMRRRPFRQKHVIEKPGRELVTFLLVCNFSLWAIDVMEAWRQQMYPRQPEFYGPFAVRWWLCACCYPLYRQLKARGYPVQSKVGEQNCHMWTLITHVSMPLIIFYRFHSSVCLSEVWKCAYKFKTHGRSHSVYKRENSSASVV